MLSVSCHYHLSSRTSVSENDIAMEIFHSFLSFNDYFYDEDDYIDDEVDFTSEPEERIPHLYILVGFEMHFKSKFHCFFD